MNFLKRLFGGKEKPVELPPEFLQSDPPDWLVELRIGASPGTSAFSARAQIHETARTGTVEVVVLPSGPGAEPKHAATALLRVELDRLLVILGFSFPDDIASTTGGEGEGTMPATVAIHRREPFAVVEGECDLSRWLDSRKSGPPVVEVARILVQTRQRALPAA
jgi:hypothetical protein